MNSIHATRAALRWGGLLFTLLGLYEIFALRPVLNAPGSAVLIAGMVGLGASGVVDKLEQIRKLLVSDMAQDYAARVDRDRAGWGSTNADP